MAGSDYKLVEVAVNLTSNLYLPLLPASLQKIAAKIKSLQCEELFTIFPHIRSPLLTLHNLISLS